MADLGMNWGTEGARQGAYLGLQTANVLQSLNEKTYEFGRKQNLEAEIGAIQEFNKQNNRETTYEDLLGAYAKYGDAQDVERVKNKMEDRDMKVADLKLKSYMGQYEDAFSNNNTEAITQIQDNINRDPYITKYTGDFKLQPNGQVTYLATKPGQILMSDGELHDVPEGAKITGNMQKGEFIASKVEGGTGSAIAKKTGGGTGGIISPNTWLAYAQATVDGKPNQYNITMRGMDSSETIGDIVDDYDMAKNYGQGSIPKIGETAYQEGMANVAKGLTKNASRIYSEWKKKNKGNMIEWGNSLDLGKKQKIYEALVLQKDNWLADPVNKGKTVRDWVATLPAQEKELLNLQVK